jgi:uncharacterized protein
MPLAFPVSSRLDRVDHRPWPIPSHPWVMTQTWSDLLFAHWPIPAEHLQPLIPAGLTLDTYDGMAWIGVVPFRMGFGLRYSPWQSRFGKLNVRTYVIRDGKPGVFFFSLDAVDILTVCAARQLYALPYHFANIEIDDSHGTIHFVCQRFYSPGMKAQFKGSYRSISPVFFAEIASLEHWLTERYCLYSVDKKQDIYRADVHHAPWPLQKAEAEIAYNTMTLASGIQLPDTEPLLYYAQHLNVVVWPLKKLPR